MRIHEKGFRADGNSAKSVKSAKSILQIADRSEGCYREEIKKLQELIRKSEIEKAELDLKLTQARVKHVNEDAVLKENRELKRQVKVLSEEVQLTKLSKKKEKLNEIIRNFSPEKSDVFKEKFLDMKVRFQRLQVKENKKIACFKLFMTVRLIVLERASKGFFSLKKNELSEILKDKISEGKSKIRRENLKKNLGSESQQKIDRNKRLRKILARTTASIFRTWVGKWKTASFFVFFKRFVTIRSAWGMVKKFADNKKNQKNRLRVYFKALHKIFNKRVQIVLKEIKEKSDLLDLKNKVLLKILLKRTRGEKRLAFGFWKNRSFDMNISELCKLHEEMRLEKDFIFEQFEIIRNEGVETIRNKLKQTACKNLILRQTHKALCIIRKKILSWAEYAKNYRKKVFESFRKIELIGRKRRNPFFYLVQLSENTRKIDGKKHRQEKMLKKVLNAFRLNRVKMKLIRKYLEKFDRNREIKEKIAVFKGFKRYAELKFLDNVKEEKKVIVERGKFLEESLVKANFAICESSQLVFAFEARVKKCFIRRLALGLKQVYWDLIKTGFSRWKVKLVQSKKIKKKLFGFIFKSKFTKKVEKKCFLKWKILKNLKKQGKISNVFMVLTRNYRKALTKSFYSWKVFNGYSELIDLIEHEKLNSLVYKINNILVKCKKLKFHSSFQEWKKNTKKKTLSKNNKSSCEVLIFRSVKNIFKNKIFLRLSCAFYSLQGYSNLASIQSCCISSKSKTEKNTLKLLRFFIVLSDLRLQKPIKTCWFQKWKSLTSRFRLQDSQKIYPKIYSKVPMKSCKLPLSEKENLSSLSVLKPYK